MYPLLRRRHHTPNHATTNRDPFTTLRPSRGRFTWSNKGQIYIYIYVQRGTIKGFLKTRRDEAVGCRMLGAELYRRPPIRRLRALVTVATRRPAVEAPHTRKGLLFSAGRAGAKPVEGHRQTPRRCRSKTPPPIVADRNDATRYSTAMTYRKALHRTTYTKIYCGRRHCTALHALHFSIYTALG